ncbi:hypothetical protein RR46_12033 [Papilio xuthus]|uniref:Uncharacterized protein n=1 Tax=Papilio xuthus TaxID=66420 RepID=A0A194PQL4_PAPXU|nr:hypothetical protein RR46_12033 [Papilio xuthus]
MHNEDSLNNSTSSELNFIDQWSDVTVLKEISKGAILRQHKVKQSTYKDVYDSVNCNYDEPSTSKSNQMHHVIRKPVCIKTGKMKRRKSPKRCPMRIAQLSVPTKRQCIDTWRTKATVIPNFMVSRIKKTHSVAEKKRIKELNILCAIFGYKIALKLRQPMNISLNYRLEKINSIVKEEIDTILQCKTTLNQKLIKNKEILEEISRKVTIWIDTILDESEIQLLEENLQELEEEEGPVLDLIDDLVEEVLIICVPPNLIKSTEKLTEDDLLSDLSKDKSMEEQISNITEININDLVIDLYTNALEYAERQKETQEDYFLTEGITNIQQSVDLLSIGSESEYVLEDFRGELNKLIDQIVDSLMIGDDQIEEEKYVDSEEDAMEKISEHKENTNNLLQASQDSVLQEHNASINEELNLTEQTETFNVDLEHKGDDTIINDLTNETIENNKIVKEIIDDLLNTGVWSSEPNVLDDDYTKPNDTEVVQQELLENETQLNNELENIQNEAPVKDNESKQEGQDLTQINDDEPEAISLSPKISERQQIVQDLLITVFENFDLESALDENEDNKKVKFSAIDMGIGVNKKLLTKLSSQQLILQKPSSDYLKFNIDFAPPNENLLSNADESWPQNIALPIIKVTESVNKSVTSLGKIFEIDEKRISSESSYVSIQNSEILIDVQLASMSMGNSKMNDMLLARFQNENKIGTEETNKKGNDKPQRKNIDKKKQIKNKIIKNETKDDLKPRSIDKKSKDPNGKIRNKSIEVHRKPEKKYIKANKEKEIPRKDKKFPNKDEKPNKTDRIKVSVNKKDIAKNKINESKFGIKQKKQFQPVVSVKKAELITKPVDVISKEDRGDGLKYEQKKESFSCEKFFSSEQKTNLKQNGIIKIDTYDILKWCKGLENVIENLETWNSWVNSTCKCITYLKQKDWSNKISNM